MPQKIGSKMSPYKKTQTQKHNEPSWSLKQTRNTKKGFWL